MGDLFDPFHLPYAMVRPPLIPILVSEAKAELLLLRVFAGSLGCRS